MLTVNITGSATGTALNSTTSAIGSVSASGRCCQIDTPRVSATIAPTMRNSQRTTRAITSSTCIFGCAPATSCAVRPKYVCVPVAVITAVASPSRTVDPE